MDHGHNRIIKTHDSYESTDRRAGIGVKVAFEKQSGFFQEGCVKAILSEVARIKTDDHS